MRIALLAVLAACGGAPKRHVTIDTTAPAAYPGTLADPKTLHPDFMVRQSLVIHAKKPTGEKIDAELDAVLQKQGDTLLVLGLGPMNVKAFTLTQKGTILEAEQFVGPDMQFSPRNIVLDVHRVLFKRLPVPKEASTVVTGELDGEHVEETWKDGQLRTRVFTRPGFKGAVRVELGDGCTQTVCEPASAKLTNEWLDYTIEITNEGFEPL
ncbi:MAG TPA: DUF3261 domain-containing protein [Kofleriaceae bacterium]|jgi:hypothetical protein